ncbi:hypothetical protein ACFLQY_00995 [Verrucomicrobiota bacterium]
MKKNPAEKLIRERLEPGALSVDGFLGHDDRPISDIIAADVGEIEAAGLTVEEVGGFLEEIHREADRSWEGAVSMFDGKITARSIEVMGVIPCPFECSAHCHKALIEVHAGERCIQFTPLDAHMIRDHGFFEGKGSEYRIPPKDLIWLYRLCKG